MKKNNLLDLNQSKQWIKIFLTIVLVFLAHLIRAQVKVGDNPTTINADAVLDVESSDKGLLLPRVALTGTANVAPLSAHVAGMVVYNTATAGDVSPGYYYNDGTQWVRLASNASIANLYTTDGALAGNRAVTQGNFDLNFDANTLVIDGSADQVGIGTATPSELLELSGGGLQLNGEFGIGFRGESPFDNPVSADGGRIYFDFNLFGTNDNAMIFELTDRNDLDPDNGNAGFAFINTGNDDVKEIDFVIKGDGDVGVGVTDPTAKLDVNGAARIRTINSGAASDAVMTTDANGNVRSRTAAEIVAAGGGVTTDEKLGTEDQTLTANRSVTQGNFDLNFDANTLVIDGSANEVGIGTASPEGKLDISGVATLNNYTAASTLGTLIQGGLSQAGGILEAPTNQNFAIGIRDDVGTEKFAIVSGDGNYTVDQTYDKVVASFLGNGNVGIGINNPGARLDVRGSVIFNEDGDDSDFRVEGDNVTHLLYTDAGNNRVAVNTDAPTATLDVNGQARIRTINSGAASDDVITTDANGNVRSRTAAEIVAAGGGITTDTHLGSSDLSLTGPRLVSFNNFNLNFNNFISINGSQDRIGIGTSVPSSTLHVDGSVRFQSINSGAASDDVITTDANGNIRSRTAAEIVAAGGGALGTTNQTLTANRAVTQGSFDLNFDANTLLIDGSANRVGIGTAAPEEKLDIRPILFGGNQNGGIQIASTGGQWKSQIGLKSNFGGTVRFALDVPDNNSGSTLEALSISSDGLVGIGTGATNPSATLDVNGTARIRSISSGAASDEVVTTDANGNIRSRTAAEIVAAGSGSAQPSNTRSVILSLDRSQIDPNDAATNGSNTSPNGYSVAYSQDIATWAVTNISDELRLVITFNKSFVDDNYIVMFNLSDVATGSTEAHTDLRQWTVFAKSTNRVGVVLEEQFSATQDFENITIVVKHLSTF